MAEAKANPFEYTRTALQAGGQSFHFYDINKIRAKAGGDDARVRGLPFSIRVLLEAAGEAPPALLQF
jgi:hypothetical protein